MPNEIQSPQPEDALRRLAENIEITGPDDDGLVWLVLHGRGTTGKAMFNLGGNQRVAAQAARLFEQDRRAALSASPFTQPRLVAPNRIVEVVQVAQRMLSDWNRWYGEHGQQMPVPPAGIVRAQELLSELMSELHEAPVSIPAPEGGSTLTPVEVDKLVAGWAEAAGMELDYDLARDAGQLVRAALAVEVRAPLTDEQIAAIIGFSNQAPAAVVYYSIVRAVERAHGIGLPEQIDAATGFDVPVQDKGNGNG